MNVSNNTGYVSQDHLGKIMSIEEEINWYICNFFSIDNWSFSSKYSELNFILH